MTLTSWIKDRFGLETLLDHLIPQHSNSPTHVIGGTVLILGIIQGITGIILQQFYHPMPDTSTAYLTTKFIINNPLLNFIRNMHYWGSQLIIILVLLHMIRVYISAAYKKPREILWASGVFLLITLWLLAFTGTTLRWDQEAVEALKHNLELASFAGPLAYWFSPSFAPDVPILIRLYSAHVTILPVIALLLIGLHVYLIRIKGISNPRRTQQNERMVPFSTHVKRMILYGCAALILTIALSLTISAPISSLGNPEIEVSKPDWYLLWVYAVENYFGLESVPYVLTPALILILLVPALDRSDETDPRKRKLMITLLIITILIFVLFTINAALTPPRGHLE